MGRPKALLPIGAGRETFLDRITRTLLDGGVEEVVVVLGSGALAIRAAAGVDSGRVRLVDNPDYEKGQLSSLVASLRTVDRPGVSAALVALIDSPLISAGTVRALLSTARERGALIVRPASNGRHGHPVIFGRAVFDELRRTDPSEGASAVVRAHRTDVIEVAVDDVGAFIDINSPEDYERWIGPFPE